jgi:PPOX class probable F420-dependent enzyme
MTGSDLAGIRRLGAAEHGLAVVGTTRADGSVHASVVNAGVLDHPVTREPAIGFVARGDARKLVHIRREGCATVVFRSGWQWAAVDGPAQICGPDDVMDGVAPDQVATLLRDVFRAAGGTHDDWDEYDRVMAQERRAAVLVTPARVIGNA